ncbi:MAG TPA: hypothetical protein VND40_03035 [Nitrososphaerales archaeon]|nr:hypothetical protein [Nitrososphaerales archaeon]
MVVTPVIPLASHSPTSCRKKLTACLSSILASYAGVVFNAAHAFPRRLNLPPARAGLPLCPSVTQPRTAGSSRRRL